MFCNHLLIVLIMLIMAPSEGTICYKCGPCGDLRNTSIGTCQANCCRISYNRVNKRVGRDCAPPLAGCRPGTCPGAVVHDVDCTICVGDYCNSAHGLQGDIIVLSMGVVMGFMWLCVMK